MQVREALGAYEGFSAQERQAFLELLTTHDMETVVRLEAEDDISVITGDTIQVIQCKASPAGNGDSFLRNRSNDFWKTIDRWVQQTADGGYNGLTVESYRYSIIDTALKPRTSERISDSFKDARGTDEAQKVLAYAYKKLTDDSSGKSVSGKLQEHLDVIFDPKNSEAAVKVIDLFQIENHPDLQDEIAELFRARAFISAAHNDALLHQALGWTKNRLAEFSQDNQAPEIRYAEFIEWIRCAADQFRNDHLYPTVEKPDEERVRLDKDTNPVYIQQLHEIQPDGFNSEEEDLKAIVDRLRSADQIVQWVKEDGLLTNESIDNYRDELMRTWDIERMEALSSSQATDSKSIGRKIYIGTRRSAGGAKLAGYNPPGFVADGQLHELANVDDIVLHEPRIVWNPNFISIARERLRGDSE